MQTERTSRLKIFEDNTGNRTRNLPSCGAVTQTTAPPVATTFATTDIIMCQVVKSRRPVPVDLLSDYPSNRRVGEVAVLLGEQLHLPKRTKGGKTNVKKSNFLRNPAGNLGMFSDRSTRRSHDKDFCIKMNIRHEPKN